jgi:hypothetical protein
MTNQSDRVTERTYIVTLIDEQVRPKTIYEKVTKVVNDWCFPMSMTVFFFMIFFTS